jgi:hypothetical protein
MMKDANKSLVTTFESHIFVIHIPREVTDFYAILFVADVVAC